jgi:signal transduction histidine kinase
MNIFRTSIGPARQIRSALLAGILVAAALLALAALEARSDVAPAGTALADLARATADGATPEGPDAARALLVEAGLATARIVAPDGTTLVTRGSPERWDAGPAGVRAWPAGVGAENWSLQEGVLEARAGFTDGGVLMIRTGRRAQHGEVGGLLPIAITALLAALLVAGLQLAARRRRGHELASAASALAALPALPGRRPARQDEWPEIHQEIRRAASRWATADGRRGPHEISALLDPLDHPLAIRDARATRVDNPAFESLRTRLPAADAEVLDTRVRELLARRGPCADRIPVGVGHLDVEAWDAGDTRIAAVTDRGEADRIAALRRRIAGAGKRYLTAPLTEIRRQAGALAGRDDGAAPLRIVAAADRLEALIDRMLRESDASVAGSELRPIGLPGLLWGMARRWDDELRSRALRVELDLAAGLPAVRADPAMLDEVLSELVDNAASFSPRGAAITLTATGDDAGVTLAVRDAGPGIASDEVPVAREPFWRSDDADAVPGAGLGLGVADAMAHRMGGSLEIDPGPGGCVRLVLRTTRPAVSEAA